ncbi:MAG TPA: hypothetical protein VGM74_01800 [Burkholderiaceae bacterium]|jgi:hypothetical protein
MKKNDPVTTLTHWGAAALVAGALAGCATPGNLPLGSTMAAARQVVPGPSAEYALPDGGTRLEFDRYKAAWMLDFDNRGVLQASTQALTEQNLGTITPGMTADEVRMRFGRPIQVFGTGWSDPLQIWNYRFSGGDCIWYQVSIRESDHKVREAGVGMDPICDGGHDKGAK